MLLQTALVITMAGLVTHVGDERIPGADLKKRSAAIVVDEHNTHHHASLKVRKCFLETLTEDFEYDLKPGDRIHFTNGVTSGPATATERFVEFTPSLQEPLTNSRLSDAVKDRQRHDNVMAWLDYPKGTLDIAWYHVHEARFFRSGDLVRNQCVPKATWFVAPTTDGVFMHIDNPELGRKTIKLKKLALVEITNQGRTPSTDDVAGTAHFANYGGLLERRYGLVPRRIAEVKLGGDCGNTPVHAGVIGTESLATLVETPFPAMAAELRGACKKVIVGTVDNDHPACTNTDWP